MLSNGGDHTLSQGRPTRKVGFDVTTCMPLSRFVFISFEFPCERRNTLQRSSKLVLPRCAWIALRSRCHGQLKWRLFKDTIIDMLVQPAEDTSTKAPNFYFRRLEHSIDNSSCCRGNGDVRYIERTRKEI